MTRLTRRDVSVLRDLALSHLLSRDQLMNLGYFGSVTRANTRMRDMIGLGFVKRLESPFFGQSLFMVTKDAADVVGERISGLIENRASSPRFVQHAMSVTNVRIALSSKSKGTWRFEQQLWRTFTASSRFEVRPDGLFQATQPIFVEVDMGHASASRFKEKLVAYQALARSGQCQSLYGFNQFRVLTVTSGSLRSRHLHRLLPQNAGFEFLVRTFEEVGATRITPWS